MISRTRRAAPRTVSRVVPLVLAGAAMLLSGCVVPIPASSLPAQRQSSMLASDATCPAETALGAAFEQPIDPNRLNQKLLSEALRDLVNAERCSRGAAPIGLSIPAIDAAAGHAGSMARLDFISHTSPVGGRETLERRLRAASANYRLAGENVARAPASSLSKLSGGCLASVTGGVPAPSYADVAKGLFAMWNNSKVHRDNILHPSFSAFGAGIGVNPGKYNCGEIASAMVFVG